MHVATWHDPEQQGSLTPRGWVQISGWDDLKGSHSQLNAQLAKVQREKAALLGDQERTRLGFEAATVELAQSHATQLHRAATERRGLETELVSLRSQTSELESRSSQMEEQLSALSQERASLQVGLARPSNVSMQGALVKVV